MPRTLPWLVRGATKKGAPTASPAPRQSRKRSSSPADLVNSDLDALPGTEPPKRTEKKPKKRVERSSSPPAPTAPEFEYMNEGYGADDIYMMVEDEFDSTARSFTQHIHHAEYQRLRRLHKSRGAETLRRLDHGTDGSTAQSRALRLKMEAQELAKKRNKTPESESESDDEYQMDPQLAGLMASSQRAKPKDVSGLTKAKSKTRAAAGYLQSPHKANKWKEVPSSPVPTKSKIYSVPEEESTDEDDLDAAPRAAKPTARPRSNVAEDRGSGQSYQRENTKAKTIGFFKAFAKPPVEGTNIARKPEKTLNHSNSSSPTKRTREGREFPAVPKTNNSSSSHPIADRSARVAEILARRRQTANQSTGHAAPAKIKQQIDMRRDGTKQDSNPRSYNTFGSSKPETKGPRADHTAAQRKKSDDEEKKEDKKKKKNGIKDIPLFLF
ncbi:Hypothetical predicted protein [Lecanosticta acicola]|uniref:Uncharacterized protein n=1 Tax=Lecanosticta acicola TaxID=111012 RepID=A0AAI9EBR3_9PEZI|nr:Hypothetical predicted protein [Lecanosticta acicola]